MRPICRAFGGSPLLVCLLLGASCDRAAGQPHTPYVAEGARDDAGSDPAVMPVQLARWPHPGFLLKKVEVPPALRRDKWRIYLDPGHGAPGNQGSLNVDCEAEQDFTLRVADHLATALRRTGQFEVRLARSGGAAPRYQARVREAESWRADALLSLHADVRGQAQPWAPRPGAACWRNDTQPGFAILWSDDAPAQRQAARRALARSVARWMGEAGFTAYDGADYPGLYDGDADPGVFVDRHAPGQRIFMLRRPRVPSVIIETHHAWHLEEVTRWNQAETLDAFSAAVAAALVDFLTARERR